MGMNRRLWLAAGLIAATVALSGCEQKEAARSEEKPAKVVRVQGSDLGRVVLTQRAAERLGIKTQPVREVSTAGGSTPNLAVPVAALLYDQSGGTWVYAMTGPLTYERNRVTVARIAGDLAILQSGPPAGTPVVTVGAAELLGSENGVEGE
jgi:hypothetical protein